MCGVCGIATGDPEQQIEVDLLVRMADAIAYRGPDDSGVHVGPGIGLAMRRLSIIDLATGHQPMQNKDRTVHLVFNGELYNYRELRAQLRAQGHEFRTESDTEVVVHAYDEWGTSCLDSLRGMFAFAMWDDRAQKLVLAVDRFGIKPLYFGVLDGGLVFGSELRCLLVSGRLTKEIDDTALAEYFTLGYIPPPRTIFRHARKLEPGTALEWTRSGGPVVHRYWDVPPARNDGTVRRREEVQLELRELLRDSVRAHLVSDVPVGAFLSGGIDSSSVVALMSEVSSGTVRTFSVGFEAQEHDERPLARLVAERFGTDHHEFVLEPESVDVLPKLVQHFQEPFADSSALPTYYISKLARSFVKVALSGDGGDELFVGYPTFIGVELARHAQRLPAVARRALTALPNRVPWTVGSRWGDRINRWRKWAADTALPPEDAYRSKLTMAGLPTVKPLLAAELRDRLDREDPFRTLDAALARAPTARSLERILYAGLNVSLPGDMLVKVDRMSMANSLEVRVPLLDHVVAEFVTQLPVSLRFPRWRLKALLKDTMASSLPREVLKQRKHGFTIPLASWFRGDLNSFAREILLGADARGRGFLDTRAIEAFLREHTRGSRNLGSAIWSLLMFELWCREVLD